VDALEMRRRLAKQGTTPQAKEGKSDQVAQALNNYGRYYIEVGDPVRAEGLFRESLAMSEELRKGRENVGCAYALQNLGDSLMRQSEEAEVSGDSVASREKAELADAAFAEGLAIRRKIYKNGNNLVCSSLNGLARADLREGNVEVAQKLAGESVALYESLYGNSLRMEHPDAADGRWTLGLAELASGDSKGAIKDLLRALEIAERAKPRPEFVLTRLRGDLGLALAKTDTADMGETQLKRALEDAKGRHKEGATEIALAARKLVEFYRLRSEEAKAQPYLSAAKLGG
jgi:tetratricopeptide (TPR) repeat protein